MTKNHGSYLCSIYIFLRNIFLCHKYFGHKYMFNACLKVMVHIYAIYMAHKYIFDASMLWKEMVDILLLTFLELFQVASS